MAIVPINLARISQNLQAFNLLESVRANQAGLFRVQNQLATGLRVLRPSDDPLDAAATASVDRRLDKIEQVQRNLLYANNALTQGESAMLDAVNAVMNVQSVASQSVGDTIGDDERRALAPLVDSALDQLVAIGNRQYLDAYLFGGYFGGATPFEVTDLGVLYRGDTGQASTMVDSSFGEDIFTCSGADFFSAVSTAVHGINDLNPALTAQTRISELRGTTGAGVTLGRIAVSAGTEQVEIDLSGADTVGDLLDKLNSELPAGIVASLNNQAITIGSALGNPPVTIRDVGGGQAARDLGLSGENLQLAGQGVDLDPQLTLRTTLAELNGGLGLDVSAGLTIQNGGHSVTLDFSGAQTIEDVLGDMNQADVGVWARVASDGRTIEVLNRVSGSNLTVGENGGLVATALGIRSLNGGTALAGLNDGRGVDTVDGNDLRIVTADGGSFEIDVDGAATLHDVINRLNTASGGAISADLAASGNGLMITDNTTGSGTLSVERVNMSPALDGLGLDVAATGNVLVGRDVNPIRVDNAFTALMELRDGLRQDDTRTIAWAGARLDRALEQMQEVQGRMAAQAQAMDKRSTGLADEQTAAQVMLSNVRDVDITDAVVKFQQMQTALQANLATAARIMNLSLLDYLS